LSEIFRSHFFVRIFGSNFLSEEFFARFFWYFSYILSDFFLLKFCQNFFVRILSEIFFTKLSGRILCQNFLFEILAHFFQLLKSFAVFSWKAFSCRHKYIAILKFLINLLNYFFKKISPARFIIIFSPDKVSEKI
jgi:hypothetical protein